MVKLLQVEDFWGKQRLLMYYNAAR